MTRSVALTTGPCHSPSGATTSTTVFMVMTKKDVQVKIK